MRLLSLVIALRCAGVFVPEGGLHVLKRGTDVIRKMARKGRPS